MISPTDNEMEIRKKLTEIVGTFPVLHNAQVRKFLLTT